MKLSFALISSTIALMAGAASAGTIKVPANFASIQQAVDAAQTGDVILIGSGLYHENVTITTNGITLKGTDVTIDGAYLGSCIAVNADGVSVVGLRLVNGGSPDGTVAPGEGGGLLYVGSRASLVNLEVTGSARYGISLTGDGEIRNCVVGSCLGTGLLLETGNQAGDPVLVISNEVVRNGAGIQGTNGPFTLARNVVSNNAGNGVELTMLAVTGGGTISPATELTSNTIVGNDGTGLLVLDEVGAVRLVDGGTVSGNGVGLDISSTGIAISGITVSFNTAGGIFLHTDNASIDHATVQRNTLAGIIVSSFNGAANGLNSITDTRVLANGGDGIYVISGNNMVRHNDVRNNMGDGIQVAPGAVANTFDNNRVRNSNHDGIDNWGTETLVINNVISGSIGVDLAGLGDGNGTCNPASTGNELSDASGETTLQKLELITLTP